MSRSVRLGVLGTAAIGLVLGGLGASPAFAAGSGAQKTVLLGNVSGSCDTGGTAKTPEGFTVINVAGSQVTAIVSLKGALPNATYYIYLNQPGTDCFPYGQSSITTNGQGNGTGQITAPASSTGSSYFTSGIGINNSSVDVYASPVVTVS